MLCRNYVDNAPMLGLPSYGDFCAGVPADYVTSGSCNRTPPKKKNIYIYANVIYNGLTFRRQRLPASLVTKRVYCNLGQSAAA